MVLEDRYGLWSSVLCEQPCGSEVPRDRNGTFKPQLIEKHQTRFSGFDDEILSMYALGMTTRDIQGHPQDCTA